MTEKVWERNAREVENVYGGYVDWEERFYHCPYCDEPVLEEDWSEDELNIYLCPICEDLDAEDDE